MAYFFQVVVLTAHAQTFLGVGAAARLGVACAEYNVFPLVHTCVGEHQRGIVFDDHGGRCYDGVSVLLEIFLVGLADFVGCQHTLNYDFTNYYLLFVYDSAVYILLRFTDRHRILRAKLIKKRHYSLDVLIYFVFLQKNLTLRPNCK